MSLKPESPISKEAVSDVADLCQQKFADFKEGMALYLQAKVPNWQPRAEVIAEIGGSRLLDYGGQGEAVLLVPPLINRASILEDFAQALSKGARVFLLDWGVPTDVEAEFGGQNYAQRIAEFAAKIPQPFHMLGYCMGGVIAMRASVFLDLKSIILLATPWNFEYLQQSAKSVQKVGAIPSQIIPSEMLQNLFFALDPWRVFNKFSALPNKSKEQQESFFAIEKWVNDGVPMPKKLFVECVDGWIGVGDLGFDVAEVSVPVFAACPESDKIVPLSASTAIADALPNCTVKQYKVGHIGLVIKDVLHDDIFSWINRV